jgi:hypothetical protein
LGATLAGVQGDDTHAKPQYLRNSRVSFIGHSGRFVALRQLYSLGEMLGVLDAASGKLTTMREVDLSLQLEALFKRSLHKLALDVARSEQSSPAVIAR